MKFDQAYLSSSLLLHLNLNFVMSIEFRKGSIPARTSCGVEGDSNSFEMNGLQMMGKG